MKSSIVSKLVNLLNLVSESQKPLSFTQLVRLSGLNKSTLHRLLSIATEEDLLQYDASRKVYLLGPTVFDLVRNAYSGYDIQSTALEEMIGLHDRLDGNVTLGVPNGLDVIYLRVLEARNPGGSFQRPGMHERVHCSASGKALLAFMPDKLVASKLDGYEFQRFTDRTIVDLEAFWVALRAIRSKGYGTNDREEYDHLVGISAPIFNHMEEPVAVLNIWTVHAHHPLSEIETWSDHLVDAAGRVTTLIGGSKPDLKTL